MKVGSFRREEKEYSRRRCLRDGLSVQGRSLLRGNRSIVRGAVGLECRTVVGAMAKVTYTTGTHFL